LFLPPGCRFRLAVGWRKMAKTAVLTAKKGKKRQLCKQNDGIGAI
jgi:hypothetical protein